MDPAVASDSPSIISVLLVVTQEKQKRKELLENQVYYPNLLALYGELNKMTSGNT